MISIMTLLEEIGFDVTNFLIIIVTIVVVYFAWRTTNVREDRLNHLQRTAVLIIENNRMRLNNRVAQNPVTLSLIRSSSRQSNASNATEELEINDDQSQSPSPSEEELTIAEPPNLFSVLDEINNLHYDQQQRIDSSTLHAEQIIQEMDNQDDELGVGLRRRRFMFDHSNEDEPATTTTIANGNTTTDNDSETHNADNCTNENNENINMSRTETAASSRDQTIPPTKVETKEVLNDVINSEMRIKLKYLNDDLKLVSGQPSEAVGEFKKRNFSVELAAQKVVRLVFNGHVLQPDSKTLQACGLFDNCVVHCLIHNRKPAVTTTVSQIGGNAIHQSGGQRNLNNDQQNVEAGANGGRAGSTDLLIYFGRGVTGLILAYGWYCRIRYSYLFTYISTSGLIIVTGIYFVLMMINVFIEIDPSG